MSFLMHKIAKASISTSIQYKIKLVYIYSNLHIHFKTCNRGTLRVNNKRVPQVNRMYNKRIGPT